MKRKFDYVVAEEQDGIMVKAFLKEKGYSSNMIAELKKQPCEIQVNKEHAFVNKRIYKGDCVTILLEEAQSSSVIEPEFGPLSIIYEDEDILVVDKPAGIAIHPSMNQRGNTLANYVMGYYHKQGIPYVFRCINRLDKDTSGVVLLPKHMISAGMLSRQMKGKELIREYRAMVCGQVQNEGVIDLPIGRAPGSIVERMIDMEQGQKAVTHYKRLEYCEMYSYVSIWLETGRTHQIRVHMKAIGHPLPGDYLYYPHYDVIERQPLHSYAMEFLHPITKKKMRFQAPLPADMSRIKDLIKRIKDDTINTN